MSSICSYTTSQQYLPYHQFYYCNSTSPQVQEAEADKLLESDTLVEVQVPGGEVFGPQNGATIVLLLQVRQRVKSGWN
jgi:hypothetical protein